LITVISLSDTDPERTFYSPIFFKMTFGQGVFAESGSGFPGFGDSLGEYTVHFQVTDTENINRIRHTAGTVT